MSPILGFFVLKNKNFQKKTFVSKTTVNPSRKTTKNEKITEIEFIFANNSAISFVRYLNVVSLQKITFRTQNIPSKFLVLFGPFHTPFWGLFLKNKNFQKKKSELIFAKSSAILVERYLDVVSLQKMTFRTQSIPQKFWYFSFFFLFFFSQFQQFFRFLIFGMDLPLFFDTKYFLGKFLFFTNRPLPPKRGYEKDPKVPKFF
jgi:hypothetical protein